MLFLTTIVMLVVVCCYRKYLNVMVELTKSTGKFVTENWEIFGIALMECVCGMVILVWWVVELWGLTKAKEIYIRN